MTTKIKTKTVAKALKVAIVVASLAAAPSTFAGMGGMGMGGMGMGGMGMGGMGMGGMGMGGMGMGM